MVIGTLAILWKLSKWCKTYSSKTVVAAVNCGCLRDTKNSGFAYGSAVFMPRADPNIMTIFDAHLTTLRLYGHCCEGILIPHRFLHPLTVM